MRKLLSAAAALSFVALSSAASAQESGTAHTANKDFHIGIGAGLSLLSPVIVGGGTLFAGPFGGGSFVIPLDIAGVIRIEPEIAFFHYNESTDTTSDSATAVRAAAGIFYMFGIGKDAQGTIGARLGPQFVSSSEEREQPDPNGGAPTQVTTSRSAVNFAVGPAFGGEYFFSEYFSLGAEAQLNFIFLGEENISIDPGPDPGGNGQSGFAAHTNAILFARVFFL